MGGNKVRWALLGLDHWYTASGLLSKSRTDHAELYGVWHSDDTLLNQLTKDPIRQFDSWQEAITDPNIDLIVSCSHTRRNQDIVEAAIDGGKNVISVKPLAMDEATAQRLYLNSKEKGIRLFSFDSGGRLSQLNKTMKEIVESDWFGKVLSFTGIAHSRLPAAAPGVDEAGWWIDSKLAPGGGWIDHAIYHIDLCRWLTGHEFINVIGRVSNVKHHDILLEDFGASIYEMSNGAIVNLQHTWHIRKAGPGHTMIEIVGSNGSLLFDSTEQMLCVTDKREGTWRRIPVPTERDSFVDHVAAVMLGKAEPVATAYDAFKNFQVCLAFYKAAKQQRFITIPNE